MMTPLKHLLHTNIDQTFITQTVEFWNRWIRLVMLLHQSIEHVSIVYTC